ncbi:MAG: dienelactone hydrolase family protein [Acidobacteriota bacterium]
MRFCPLTRRGLLGAAVAFPASAQMPPDQAGPARVQADAGSLYPTIETLAPPAEYPLSFLQARYRNVEEWRRQARAAVLGALGPAPAAAAPQAETVARFEERGIVFEKILFSTAPGVRVPAYLLRRKDLKTPSPAIVDLHSHGGMFLFGKEKVIDFGENHPAMREYHAVNYGGRPTATELARRGYVVITIDAFPFGERRYGAPGESPDGWERAKLSLEDVRRLNAECRAKESAIVKTLTYAGLTWPGVTAWDDIRTVDYLCTRPEVDVKRIGCVGVSFGGWRSLFLGALDDRIRACCIAGFMSTVRPMMRGHMDTHSFVHFVPGLHRHMDLPDVAGLRAGRPLMVLQCRGDALFPPEGMQASVDKLAAIYAKAGAKDLYAARFYEGPHRFDVPMQEDAFAWLERWLKP